MSQDFLCFIFYCFKFPIEFTELSGFAMAIANYFLDSKQCLLSTFQNNNKNGDVNSFFKRARS